MLQRPSYEEPVEVELGSEFDIKFLLYCCFGAISIGQVEFGEWNGPFQNGLLVEISVHFGGSKGGGGEVPRRPPSAADYNIK